MRSVALYVAESDLRCTLAFVSSLSYNSRYDLSLSLGLLFLLISSLLDNGNSTDFRQPSSLRWNFLRQLRRTGTRPKTPREKHFLGLKVACVAFSRNRCSQTRASFRYFPTNAVRDLRRLSSGAFLIHTSYLHSGQSVAYQMDGSVGFNRDVCLIMQVCCTDTSAFEISQAPLSSWDQYMAQLPVCGLSCTNWGAKALLCCKIPSWCDTMPGQLQSASGVACLEWRFLDS